MRSHQSSIGRQIRFANRRLCLWLFAQQVGSQFGRVQGNGYAGGEDGVEEFGVLPKKGKMFARPRFSRWQSSLDGAEREIVFPKRLYLKFPPDRALVYKFFPARLLIRRPVCRACRQRRWSSGCRRKESAKSDIAMFRMRVDQDFVAVEFRAGDVVVDMREVGLARRQLGRAFQVKRQGGTRP